MKRLRRVHITAISILLLLATAAIWTTTFRTPATKFLPLPDALIAIKSSAGQKLLTESRFIADYEPLTQNFEAQSQLAFCGVASSVIVLNALRSSEPRWTQSTFFNDSVSAIRSMLQVSFSGMTLEQLGDLLRAQGLEVKTFFAADTNAEAFRAIAQQNLQTSGDFLLVNYQRATLGQGASGHISPLAAYNAAADRFLILDVAAYKYPPVWVTTEALWNAMNTVDSASGRTRGFVVVKKPVTKE